MIPLLPYAVTTDPHVSGARTAVLPVGSFEQHGPHLPLSTDTLIAVAIAQAIATDYELLLLPPVTVSCSHEHAAFPGTVSLSPTTLAAVIADISASLRQHHIKELLVVNAHGGNYVLANIAQQANAEDLTRMALYPTREDWHEARQAAAMTSDPHEDMHAGELETSILLATVPDYLRAGWEEDDHTHSDRRHLTTLGMTPYTPSGVIGQPSLATAEKGTVALKSLTATAVNTLRVLQR